MMQKNARKYDLKRKTLRRENICHGKKKKKKATFEGFVCFQNF